MEGRVIAIVGSDTLVGAKVRQVLSEQAPDIQIRLIGDEAESSILTEREGEPVVVSTIDELSLTNSQAVILAGTPESSERAFEILSKADSGIAVIDLTGALDDRPDAVLRAPLAGTPPAVEGIGGVHVLAHPAALALAEFYLRLHAACPMEQSLAHVFEPASEWGKEGIGELQSQAVGLLSFKSIPQEIFDTQLCFNMLARYGAEAKMDLDVVESRIYRHLGSLLARGQRVPPLPSLRLIQAPVFHGHSFSVWAEFEDVAEPAALIKALASDRIEIRSGAEEPPTNSSIVGQSGIIVGRVEQDRRNPHAAWFWMVADNHRITAENTACLARLLVPVEGSA